MVKLIGISAFAARSGKDTLAQCLQTMLTEKGYKAEIRSLANPLKEKLSPFLKEEFNVDIFNCSDEEKSLVRNMLVAYGGAKRKQTKGRYWTGLMDAEIEKLNKEGVDYLIVPDIRYCEFDGDECDWITTKGGTLFFISMLLEDGSRLPPPNEDEARNGPLLEERAHVKIEWRHMGPEECLKYVRENFDNLEEILG